MDFYILFDMFLFQINTYKEPMKIKFPVIGSPRRNFLVPLSGNTFFYMFLSAALLFGTGLAAENTSKDNEFLRKALQQYPVADANKDGVLTETEARAYEKKMKEQQNGGQSRKDGEKKTAVPPDFANITYGPYRRNVLDFWKAKSDSPAPVFVFFHGGGFMGGDKSNYIPSILAICQANGISFASANYRLISGDGAAPFPAPMLDGARVIQFLRTKAREWNIDPKRIAIGGGSAGANLSLWVALHDDLADPKSADPVLRESSRVSCVISWDGQTSNDPHIFQSVLGGPKTDYPSLLQFFGAKTRAELETPAMRKMAEEASAVNYATKEDPPILLIYGRPMTPVPLPETTDWSIVIHHPAYGKILKDKLDPLGVHCEFYHSGDKPPADCEQKFLSKYLVGDVHK